MFLKEFEHCRVKADETVVVVTDMKSRQDYVSAAFMAAAQLGAEPFQVNLPIGGHVTSPSAVQLGGMLRLPKPVVEAIKSAQFCLDLTMEGFIHTPERVEIVKSGTRVLRAGAQPPEILARLMPWDDADEYKKRALNARDKLKSAKIMRVTSPNGTDLTCKVEPKTAFGSYGFSDEPGRWDVWGQNMVSNYPVEVNGKVVMGGGDYVVVPFADYIRSQISLTIKNGYITEIAGDGGDAFIIRDHLESYHDKEAYAISHLGWGLNKKARWGSMMTYDRKPDETGFSANEGRVVWGNFLFSTGPNHHAGRWSPAHYDIGVKDTTISLDGEPTVERGRVVGD